MTTTFGQKDREEEQVLCVSSDYHNKNFLFFYNTYNSIFRFDLDLMLS